MAEAVTAATLRRQPAPPGAVDPNIKVPRAVREAAGRAEAIQRAANGEAEPSILETPPAPQPTPETPPAPQPTPETPPAPQPTPETPPAAQPQAVSQPDWERQFHSINGRFDQSQQQMRQMTERMQALEAENRRLKATPTEAEPTPPALVDIPLTQQEIDDYGPDFVDMMRRVVTAATQPLHAQIGQLQGQVGQVATETANSIVARMNATMEGLVPGWSAINRDPKFIAWSQLPDVFSNAMRSTLMQEAWNAGDAHRVAAFFRAFAAEEAATDPQRAGASAPQVPRTTVTSVPMSPQTLSPTSPFLPAPAPVALEALAAPGRAHSPGTTPAEKPVYTSADVTRFYADVSAGRWRGREQQQAAIDADIIQAGREGRIIPDQRYLLPNDPRVTSR